MHRQSAWSLIWELLSLSLSREFLCVEWRLTNIFGPCKPLLPLFLSFSRVTSEQNLLGRETQRERERERERGGEERVSLKHTNTRTHSHTDTNKENPVLDTETQSQNLYPGKRCFLEITCFYSSYPFFFFLKKEKE
jgi:hypothetical protein